MRYKALIALNSEVHEVFTTTNSDSKALKQAVNKLAKKLGRTAYSIRNSIWKGCSFEIIRLD